jgi:hypothetical protein
MSNVPCLRGDTKAYETLAVIVQEITVPSRKAAAFQLDVPLSDLKSGFYTCQVNVIDDAAGTIHRFETTRLPFCNFLIYNVFSVERLCIVPEIPSPPRPTRVGAGVPRRCP